MAILRPIAASDAPRVQELASHPEVIATTMLPSPYPEGGALEFIQRSVDRRAEGRDYVFAVQSEGELVGVCALHDVALPDVDGGSAELGYWIGRPFWGRRLASTAARELVGWAFEHLPSLDRLTSHCIEGNVASQRILAGLGFEPTGSSLSTLPKWQPPVRVFAFELPREAWRPTPGTDGLVATTERLRLRRITTADAPWALRLLNEPSFIANIADRGVRTEEQAARYLEIGPIASYATHGYGMYAVELRTTGEPLGMCGLVRRQPLEQADLGYAFFPAHWGRGYAREAATASVEIARSIGLPDLLAIVNPDNAASIRLLEALGFGDPSPVQLSPDEPSISCYRLDLSRDP